MSSKRLESDEPENLITGQTSAPPMEPRNSLVRPTDIGVSSSSADRRSVYPEAENFRAQFEQMAEIIHRCSIDASATDTEGEYVFNNEIVRDTLAAEVQTLRSQDALIGLMLLIDGEKNGTGERIPHRKIGCYKFIWPSAKSLNDSYLGPSAKDEFDAELHAKIAEVLGKSRASLLKANFKTGIFEIDASLENNVAEKLSAIPREAATLLIKHIDRRLETLLQRITVENPGKIGRNMGALEELKRTIQEKGTIDIAFGFDEVGQTDEGMWLSIRNAECAANIASIEKIDSEEDSDIRFCATDYSNSAMMKALCYAYMRLNDVLDPESDTNEVLEAWKPFFYYDQESQEIRMNPEMIGKYRKLEKYRQSKEYKQATRTREEKAAYEDRLAFFGNYYKLINIIDVLKNFTLPTFPHYIRRARNIASLIQEAEAQLRSPSADGENERRLLMQIQSEMEISLKDEGAKIVRTTRAMVKELMQSKGNIIIFGDNIEFGIHNQAGYEASAFGLLRLLGITPEEFVEMAESPDSFHRIIEEKTAALEITPEFKQQILQIGDEGTLRLRANEEKLHDMFPGDSIINADGGDETVVILNPDKCMIPAEPEASRHIQTISYYTRMDQISPMPIHQKGNRVTPAHRKQIIRYLRARGRAEVEHELMKERESAAKANLLEARESGDSAKIRAAMQQIRLNPIAIRNK